MMTRMLSQLPLPLLPAGAAEIAPGVGLLAGGDGGLVIVHGLATFAWDAGDEAGRRLAAVQLVRVRAASQGQVAEAFGVDPATVWRWDQALAAEGVAGLVPSRRGPKGASKLTPELAARIAALDAAGATLREIAAAAGVSTFSVRNALGRVASRGPAAADAVTAAQSAVRDSRDGDADAGALVPVLPDPVPREGERALARWGLLGEGAVPVFTAGAPSIRWPGCCWRCPRSLTPGCWPVPARCTGGCGTGSTAWRRCWSWGCSRRCSASRAPRAPPASISGRWAGCWAWTGPRR